MGTANIHIPDIHLWRAGIHPFCQCLSCPASRLNADRIKTGRHKKTFKLRGFTQKIAIIRGKALRAIEKGLNTCAFQQGQAANRLFKNGREMVKIIWQGGKLEILCNAIPAPWFGNRLKRAQQQFAGILFIIGTFIRDTQNRQITFQIGDLLGNDIKMLARMKRHGHACHLANITCPHTPAIHHIFCYDIPFIGRNTCDSSFIFCNGGYLYPFKYFCAHCACAFGQSLCNIYRIGLPVLCQKHPALAVRHI